MGGQAGGTHRGEAEGGRTGQEGGTGGQAAQGEAEGGRAGGPAAWRPREQAARWGAPGVIMPHRGRVEGGHASRGAGAKVGQATQGGVAG